jgi:nicotinamidase-related amidase
MLGRHSYPESRSGVDSAPAGKVWAVSNVATIVIDMLNPYDHEDGEALAAQVAERIEPLKALIAATPDAGAELVYVNDNYDDFAATSKDLGESAMNGRHPELVEPILPPKGTQFVQKVRHSAFYSTALDHLLRSRDLSTVVLAGQVTEQCILYSALDAYVRGFEVRVARDAVVPLDPELGDAALKMMERNMRATVVPGTEAFG